MAFLDDSVRSQIADLFKGITGKAIIKLFTQPEMGKCQYCREIEEIYGELAACTPAIELQTLVLLPDLTDAKELGIIEMAPATVILDGDHRDTGIRFYGVPAGYEFTTLVETLLMVARGGDTGLSPAAVSFARSLSTPIDLKVFVSLSCPYCPAAVHLAHQLAFASQGKIRSSMIESAEFPVLANRFQVRGVPRTVINDNDFIEGAAPEEMLLEKLRKNA